MRLFRPRVREEAIAAATEVMRSGWLGMGPKTAEFEQAFAEYLGVPYAVGVNTCTSALHLAVRLLNLAPGTEVITTPATFVSTNTVLLWERLTPAFADIDPRTGNVTPESVKRCIGERTGALMLMHFGGYACDLEGLGSLAQQHGLPIVEDCAHACGAWYKNCRVGASGNLCAFSFGAIKNLTTGDGGMLITPRQPDAELARAQRYMGLSKDALTRVLSLSGKNPSWDYDVNEVGFRYHMNDIQAAMGLAHLRFLEDDNAFRTRVAARYRQLLKGVPGLALLEYADDRRSSYHMFSVLAEKRDTLAVKLAERGVIVGVHYARNDQYQIFRRANVPNAAHFCARVLSLPMHLDLTDEQIEYVAQVIREGW